ncbi:MAG: hypothetical protein GY795_21785 [Desulfobacterales bacterium]|nr:hypothetical protein [Desulfobacterales bacterium]
MKFWQSLPDSVTKFHFGTPMQVPINCSHQTPQENKYLRGYLGFSSAHTNMRGQVLDGTPSNCQLKDAR